MIKAPLSQVEVRDLGDVVPARQRAWAVASRLGFDAMDQARIAAAVSEVALDAVQRAGGVRVMFEFETEPAPSMMIRVIGLGESAISSFSGPIPGLEVARRMMDALGLESDSRVGHHILMKKTVPGRSPPLSPDDLARISKDLAGFDPPSPVEELIHQNLELLSALDEIRAREIELTRVNHELEETNRCVVALYLELDDRADTVRKVTDIKTRFLANVSHELRTPLSSILGLCHLLMGRVDGDLSIEQERQVSFIRRAANDLTGVVNDLIDLARIEVGQDEVRVGPVDLGELFGSLRAMIRPLIIPGSPVALVFDDPAGLPVLQTDEGKLSTILRNLLSNSLKFTDQGEIRLQAELGRDQTMVFRVIDTGVGIEPKNIDLVFEEFGQVETSDRDQPRGTGLGLPMVRKLASILKGRIEVESRPGLGSTFTATIPIHLEARAARPAPSAEPVRPH